MPTLYSPKRLVDDAKENPYSLKTLEGLMALAQGGLPFAYGVGTTGVGTSPAGSVSAAAGAAAPAAGPLALPLMAVAALADIGAGLFERRKNKKRASREKKAERVESAYATAQSIRTLRDQANQGIAQQAQALARGGRAGGANVTGLGSSMGQVNAALAAATGQVIESDRARLQQRLSEINAQLISDQGSADAMIQQGAMLGTKAILSSLPPENGPGRPDPWMREAPLVGASAPVPLANTRNISANRLPGPGMLRNPYLPFYR